MKKYNFNKQISRRRISFFKAFLFTAFLFIIAITTSNLYDAVDNFTVSLVVNGLFSSTDNYCIYLHPFLCWFIGFLARLLPTVDIFVLLGRILIFAGVNWLCYLVFESRKSWHTRAIELLLIAFACTILNLWNTNYTVQAAFFVMIGIIFLELSMKKNEISICIIGTIFVCFGAMWRIQAAMLFIPFALLEIFTTMIFEEKNKVIFLKKLWVKCGICFLGLGVLVVSNYFVKYSQTYIESIEYNTARTVINDYPTKSWDEIKDNAISVNEKEYNAVRSWWLADTENINVDSLQEMAMLGETTEFPISFAGAILTIKSMILFILRSSKMFWILLGIVFLLFLRIVVVPCPWYRKAEGLLACVGAIVIIFYFTIKGRAPLRIWQSVILAVISILIIITVNACEESKNAVMIDNVMGIILCVALVYNIFSVDFQGLQFAINSKTGTDETCYEETFKEDSLYLWESWHSNVTRYFMNQGKLPSEEFLKHNISVGDWTYGQVYYIEYLKELNAENPAEALLKRANTYLVSSDCTMALEYLQEHYDENIVAEKIGEIKGTSIWCFKME